MTKSKNSSENGRFLQRFIPARVIFVLLGFLGFNLVYAYKVLLSMLIIAMTNRATLLTEMKRKSQECAILYKPEKLFPGHKFDWSEDVKAQVMGAFFYGYILTQIPAGIIATKYGGKWIFGVCLLIASLLSILSPFAVKMDHRLFIAIRIVQGLAVGVSFPCMNTMIAQWMPKMERTRGSAMIMSGTMIGTVITLPLSALLSEKYYLGSWEAMFFILGIAGVVWFVLWSTLVYESPEHHPFISKEELDFIVEHEGGLKEKAHKSIPYKAMFTSVPVIALMITHFGQNWGFLTVLNLMPTYMDNILHIRLTENIIISGLPYLGQALVGWIASIVCDKVRQTGRFEITTIRKASSFLAYIPPAVCFALIPLARCNDTFSSILFIAAISINGFCSAGMFATHVDMAPNHAGALMGITNSIGNIPGFVTEIVAEHFDKMGHTVQNWSYVFYIAAGVYVVTAFVYCGFASSVEQPWSSTGPKLSEIALEQVHTDRDSKKNQRTEKIEEKK